jgi:hypothetical protein
MAFGRTGIVLVLLAFALVSWAEAGPRIHFEKDSYDYGKVLYGETVTEKFHFTNTGDQTLIIEKVRSSCGCTNAIKGSSEVPPGGQSEILTAFDTTGMRPGVKNQTVFVHSNDPEKPVVKLGITADVIRQINVDRQILAQRMTTFQEKLAFPIKIANSSNQSVIVKGLKAQDPNVTCALEPATLVLRPGGAAAVNILITLKKETGLNLYAGEMKLQTDHPREKEVGIRYFVQVGEAR